MTRSTVRPPAPRGRSRSSCATCAATPHLRSKQRDPNPKDNSLLRKETSTYKGFHSTSAALFSYCRVVARVRVPLFATRHQHSATTKQGLLMCYFVLSPEPALFTESKEVWVMALFPPPLSTSRAPRRGRPGPEARGPGAPAARRPWTGPPGASTA